MKKVKEHVIKTIEPGSIAEELELEPGDVLVSVNGQPVKDVFDYHYLINEEYLEILVRKPRRRRVGAGDREGIRGRSGH